MSERVIKFRVWDKDKKQMLPVSDISFGDDGRALTVIVQTAPKGAYYRGLVDGENGILMQFTGLFDKNGKEIWEGDIIATEIQWFDDEDDWPEKKRPEKKNRVVKNMGISLFHRGDWSIRPGEVEVIGSIYEHPELVAQE